MSNEKYIIKNILLKTLRKLRNNNSYGYDISEFKDMYELFIENEDVFVSIRKLVKYDF
ncbi:Uncharacterised protein [Clostridioides difficile]|uniref:oligo-1,6-glucosidase n=1 Tax=Clostridioides difficile TaxID=1496 RepID=UPI000D1DA6C3|nr:oligo-1,6-glucosidase [Clostridioides difficile]UWD41490.1 oligo-1,6-glucosidase [Clostridioides difficile]UWD45132.1 oligo-1,6-glucosidase [Clostridioides difficile]VFF92567.1 Uncharacterised protein [Clostridioides difficile]VIF74336.1 Uncharacterised protein [Clostridioides difficile]VIF86173.1 Uncharacterised protein [Clostridioides difficile]